MQKYGKKNGNCTMCENTVPYTGEHWKAFVMPPGGEWG